MVFACRGVLRRRAKATTSPTRRNDVPLNASTRCEHIECSVGLKHFVTASKLAPWGLRCASDRHGWRKCRKCRSNFRHWRRGCDEADASCSPRRNTELTVSFHRKHDRFPKQQRGLPSVPWMGLKRVGGVQPSCCFAWRYSRLFSLAYHAAQVKDGKIHGNDQSANQNPEYDHDQRLNQAGKAGNGIVNLTFINVGYPVHHVVYGA